MKRLLSIVLCFVLFHTVLAADAFAIAPNLYASQPPAPSRHAAKVAAAVTRLGPGNDALVAVRLEDKTVIKGRIAALEPNAFVVVDNESGVEHRVPYAQVARLQGVNIGTGVHVGIGGGFKARALQAAKLLLPVPRVPKNSLTGGEKTLLIGIIIGVLLAIVLAKTL